MSYKRGDIILVNYPNSDLVTYKKRPAIIIQNEGISTGLKQRLIALITSNTARTGASRVKVKKDSPEGKAMGLVTDSVIVADNIATIENKVIDKVIGSCTIMPRVEAALRKILGL